MEPIDPEVFTIQYMGSTTPKPSSKTRKNASTGTMTNRVPVKSWNFEVSVVCFLLLKFPLSYFIYLFMCCISLKPKCVGECSMQDHISVYVHMGQVHVHSISIMQNCQFGQYKEVHCSICTT